MFEIWLLTKSHEGKGPIPLLPSEGALSGFDSASVFQRQCKDTKFGKRNSRFLTDFHGFSRILTFLSLMVPPNKRKYTIPGWG